MSPFLPPFYSIISLSLCSSPCPTMHDLFSSVSPMQPHSFSWSQRTASVQFSHSVMSDSLRPHGLQHASPPCASPTPRVYSNSCPLSQWCHLTISSSVVPFAFLHSLPTSGSFHMSQFFTSGGQSFGISASESVLLMNIQDWFSWGWTGLISLLPKDSQESSPTPQFKSINSLALSFLYSPTLTSIHDYWKNHTWSGSSWFMYYWSLA